MKTEGAFGHMVRFGIFEADLQAGELRKNGLRVRLQEKPFELLALLLERPGQIVTREKVRDKLWNGHSSFDFDHSLGNALSRLRAALGDTASNPRFIETLPRRGYRFLAPVEVVGESAPLEPEPNPPPPPSAQKLPWAWLAGIAILGIAGYGIWFLAQSDRAPQEPSSVIPLTTYPGREIHPAFSPDGSDIAFSWTGPGGENFDIYRLQVGPGESRLQLTNDPADDLNPIWSPDGKSVVFLRALGDGRMAVIQMPSIGGAEKHLTTVAYQPGVGAWALDWSPDGEWLAIVDRDSPKEFSAVFLLSLETREKRRLTNPPEFPRADESPAFSPDGRALVFVRHYGGGCLHMLKLDSDLNPKGDPIRLASEFPDVGSPVWSTDGQSVNFATRNRTPSQLWRVPVSGRGKPEQLAAGQGSESFVISREGNRLVWVRPDYDPNIWRLTLPDPGDRPEAPQPFFSSTGKDLFPRYSPDGTRIAIQSSRSGTYEIWTCDPDGENPEQITSFNRGWSGSPRWSPDGRQIAFDSTIDGKWDLYTVSVDGGQLTRITSDPAHCSAPSWSHDGEWLYFCSSRDGVWKVWKMRITGGESAQLTASGGSRPSESVDGKWVYYLKSDSGQEDLWRVPSAGGEQEKLVEGVAGPGFTVIEDGLYYVSRPNPDGSSRIRFYRFSDGRSDTVASVGGVAASQIYFDCEVSPDRKTVLYRRVDRDEADLMLVENFR